MVAPQEITTNFEENNKWPPPQGISVLAEQKPDINVVIRALERLSQYKLLSKEYRDLIKRVSEIIDE